MPDTAFRLRRTSTVLLIVDIQERLLPAIFEKERVLDNAVRLARGAAILGVPLVVSEQYRKGLGPTVPALAEAVAGFAPVEKTAFSAWGAEGVRQALEARPTADVVLCGIEAHVCVSQTCLDLVAAGRRVLVVADAVSSRTPENRQVGLARMQSAGAAIGSTEMVLFEWLERAGTDEFKRILPLVK